MGIFHPHGDTSIYDAMKVMVNWFDINMPLIDGQGSWGSIQGDEQAAGRYTEACLQQFSMKYVLGDMKEVRDVVDWIETYTGKDEEPEYLACKVPLLLINGTFGIGIGMKSYVPMHNISEVIAATRLLLKDPNANICLVPDQCMPCDIIQVDDFQDISNTGYGRFKVRGRIEILDSIPKELIRDRAFVGKPGLLVHSTPDLVNLNKITENLNKAIDSGRLTQVIGLVEPELPKKEKNTRMVFVIVLKKGADPKFVMDYIYKLTDLEVTRTVNMEVLENFNPVRLSYKDYILKVIDNLKLMKFRFYANKKRDTLTKLHEKDAFIKVLQSGEIDKIIQMIRKQKTIDDHSTEEYLIKRLGITDLQAKYIINANLKQLSIGYLDKYIKEAEYFNKMNQFYFDKMANEDLIIKEIDAELVECDKEYGKPRNCRVVSQASINEIPEGTFKLAITEKNFIRKVPENGNIGTFKDDRIKMLLTVDNTQSILLFDASGKVFKLPVHKIPLLDKGEVDIRVLCKKLTSNIVNVLYTPIVEKFNKSKVKHFLVVQTKLGLIKKLDLADIIGAPASGIFYIQLNDNDLVNDILLVGDGLDLVSFSTNKALRFNIKDVPEQKRASKGVKSIDAECVDGLSFIGPRKDNLVVITNNGFINKFDPISFVTMTRGRQGSRVIKLKDNDFIRYIFSATGDEIIKLITKDSEIDIRVSDLVSGSSASSGKKILKNNELIDAKLIK